MNHLRHPGSIYAAFGLIDSCLHDKEHEEAEHYARHAMFMINDMADNFIPSDQRSEFQAHGSFYLARAILHLAHAGGIPPEEKQKAGQEAIELARQALKLLTQLCGTKHTNDKVAHCMNVLAGVLDYFNDVDDDEVPRLYEQSIEIHLRLEGTSLNVAGGMGNLGGMHNRRAKRARAVEDLDRYKTNMELALTKYGEAARLYRVNNHVDDSNKYLQQAAADEELIRLTKIAQAAAAVAAVAVAEG